MRTKGLERRMRKIEQQAPSGSPVFVVIGRGEPEAEYQKRVAAECARRGVSPDRAPVMLIVTGLPPREGVAPSSPYSEAPAASVGSTYAEPMHRSHTRLDAQAAPDVPLPPPAREPMRALPGRVTGWDPFAL
jgi:hypothetical protein